MLYYIDKDSVGVCVKYKDGICLYCFYCNTHFSDLDSRKRVFYNTTKPRNVKYFVFFISTAYSIYDL